MRSFLDTNVLLYCDDRADQRKQSVAVRWWTELRRSSAEVVSTQVLQEYFVNATRKLNLDPALPKRRLEQHARLEVVIPSVPLILAAIDLAQLSRISFWDALIVEAARFASCELLLSEDLQHGQIISGVRIVNPFAI